MNCRIQRVDQTVVIAPEVSCLDEHSARRLRRHVRAVLAGSKRVVLDLGQVQHVDAAGVKILLDWIRQALASNVAIAVCAGSKNTRALLEIVRMDCVVSMFDTVEDAVRAVRAANRTVEVPRSVETGSMLPAARRP